MNNESLDNAEFLKVHATVINRTSYDMILVTSHVEWGKFDEGHSPVDVPKHGSSEFDGRGSDSSSTGVSGYAVWTLRDHPDHPQIKACFDVPYWSTDKVSIECTPKGAVATGCDQSRGNFNNVTYTIG